MLRVLIILIMVILVFGLLKYAFKQIVNSPQSEVHAPVTPWIETLSTKLLFAALLVLLLLTGVQHLIETQEGPKQHYVPAHLENGVVIPAHFE
ncbi:MAG: hypothetical protein H7832_00585 [Magnetococcus sp. DMHC-6]